MNIKITGIPLPQYVIDTGITGICDNRYYEGDTVKTFDQLTTEQVAAISRHYYSEPFRKQGKVLDQSSYNQIADQSPEAVDSAIASLRKANFTKSAELIEAVPDE